MDVLQSQHPDGLGKRLLPPISRMGRMVPSRNSPLHGAGHGCLAGFTPHAGSHRWSLQGSSGTKLLVRHCSHGGYFRSFTHRLPASLGPEGLLGDCSGDQPHSRGTSRWSLPSKAFNRWNRIRTSHGYALFCPSRRCSSRSPNCTCCRPHLPVSSSWYTCQGTSTQTGLLFLAGSSAERCSGLFGRSVGCYCAYYILSWCSTGPARRSR